MKEFSRVDKKAKTKWRVSRSIGLLFLAAMSAGALLTVHSLESKPLFILAAIVCGVILLLQILNIVVYPIIEYIQWAYLIDADRIEIKKGIIWRTHTVIPISRIQHVCTKSGPLQNMFGLASVDINTAGGVHSIEELNKKTAEEICELLKNIVNIKVAEQRAKEAAAENAEVETDA